MVTKKNWDEFRETGLALFINNILHVFGWALVFEVDDETQKVTSCYPARVKFRGFGEQDTNESFERIANYLKDNIEDLHKETFEL